MLDNLLKTLKELATQRVNQNSDIPAADKETTALEVGNTIVEVLKKAIEKGQSDAVVRVITGKDPIPGNSILGEVIAVLKDRFSANMQLSTVEAHMLAGRLVPDVMGTLVTKANDPDDKSVKLRDIMQSLNVDMMGDIEGKFGKYLKDDKKSPLKNLF